MDPPSFVRIPKATPREVTKFMFSGIEYTSLVDGNILYAEYCHRYILTKMVPAGKELLDIWLVASKAIELGIVLDEATTITFADGHQL